MNTLNYPRKWQYFIFRSSIRTVRNLLYFLLNLILTVLERLSRNPTPIVSRTARMMEAGAKKTGVKLIRGYQKLLSPYKGFSCAHRLLHGNESCSQYVKKTLLEQDLRTAIALSRQRFSDCKRAKNVLRAQTIEEKEKPKKRKKRREQYYPDRSANGCFDLADCGCACLDFSSWENCDNPFPDCGDCDCGGCDCG